MAIRKYATMAMVVLLLIGTLCYLRYEEYTESADAIAETEMQYRTDKANLISTVYYSLKRDAKTRTEITKDTIKEAILLKYSNDWDQFIKDYKDPKNSALIDITSAAISTEYNMHMYVTSDANDMFILAKWGIMSDYSKTSGVGDNISYRTLDKEYPKHFNPALAKQAINTIFSGRDTDIFWQYNNSLKLKSPVITNMDVNNLFSINSLDYIRDIECLVYSSIEDNEDISGIADISPIGTVQNNNKLYIVQGFNLYEQIKQNYSANFNSLDSKYEKRLIIQNAEKDSRSLKLILLFIVMISTFVSMSTLQNIYVRGAVKYGGNTR